MTGRAGAWCPCGSGQPYDGCCGPVLRGDVVPATPEQLMRSRYTAFAVGDEAHLLASWHPRTRPRRLDLDPAVRWTGLDVLASRGGLFDAEGLVEFRARWRDGSRSGVLHERSRFVRDAGRWAYLGAQPGSGDVSNGGA